MSQLLGLSFDAPASPEISFSAAEVDAATAAAGWGVAWYPAGELAARSVHDPFTEDGASLAAAVHDWERFRTVCVVAHLRGAAKRLAHRDTQPFVRPHGGRTWCCAHVGDLGPDHAADLALPPGPQFSVVGPTDTEHLFAWLLYEASVRRASSLQELGYGVLHALLRRANAHGTLDLLLADGTDLVAYRDRSGHGPLWWARLLPPRVGGTLGGDGVRVVNTGTTDAYRTIAAVSSMPLGTEGWAELGAGEMLVLRRGAVVHRAAGSAARPSPHRPATATPASAPRDMPTGTGALGGPTGTAPLGGPRGMATGTRLLEVEHETVYEYATPVERSTHQLRLVPTFDEFQRVHSHELHIGAAGYRYRYEDVFGNAVTGFEVVEPFDRLVITARSVVEVRDVLDAVHLLPAPPALPLVWMPWQRQMMHAYLMPPELPENQLLELGVFAQSFVARNRGDLLATLGDLTSTIHRDFAYVQGRTSLATTPFEVYVQRAGVCQDFANLMICLARLLNVPARYRVGYLFTGADYANTVQSEASHAWVEVYLPQLGWRGYDPTNGTRAGTDHVRVACGRNYRDATPTAGTLHVGGAGERLQTTVRVRAC